jgi:3-hydroxyisobutyryl-CoA hydrolase
VESLVNHLSSLETPSMEMIDRTIEESYEAPELERLTPPLTGEVRVALDETFRSNSVEVIVENLKNLVSKQDSVGSWAQSTLKALGERSPTSLKVALELVRRGKSMSLSQVLKMEYRMATAYCVSQSEFD